MTTALLDTLRQIVGAAHVLTHEDPATDLTAYEQDWRKRATGRALAGVRPASTAEVAAVVKACAAARTAIIPQGGNTGLSVGGTPDASGTQVVLSLTRMNQVRAIDRDIPWVPLYTIRSVRIHPADLKLRFRSDGMLLLSDLETAR